MKTINYRKLKNGKAQAICHICGAASAIAARDGDGEPDLYALGRGWSMTPFPVDYYHFVDGSRGSRYTCPRCNKLLNYGWKLKTRAYLAIEQNATPATARRLAKVSA